MALAQIDGDEDPRIAAIDQDRNTFFGLGDEVAQLFRTGDRFAVDRNHDIARFDAGLCRRAGDILDDQAVADIGAPLFFRRQRTNDQTEAAFGGFRRVVAGQLLVTEIADLDIDLARPALAPDLKLGPAPRASSRRRWPAVRWTRKSPCR